MWASRRGLAALSSGIVRRISGYGGVRYAGAVEAPVIDEEITAAQVEESKPKKKRSPRKKADEKAVEEPAKAEKKSKKEKSSSSGNEEKNGSTREGEEEEEVKEKMEKAEPDNVTRRGNSPWKTDDVEKAPLLKTLKSIKVMLMRANGDQEVLKKKLEEYAGPFSVAALERAMAGSTGDVALQLFRWATSRPEFCYDPKAVHRFVTVLRNGDKMEEARAFVANELDDHPEVQRMAYSAIYIGYVNAKNNELAEEVLNEMTGRGYTPHPSALNRLLLMRWDRDGMDGMLELHHEQTTKGWILDAAGHNQVISALCRADRLDQAISTLLESSANGMQHYEGTYQVLVTALYSKGRMDDALKIADTMFSVMDVRTRCTPLKAFVNRLVENKRYDDALRMFEKIIQVTEPSDVKIVSLLCKAGELDRAMQVMEFVKKHGVKYNLDFKLLLAKLCEAKRVSDARKVFDVMVDAGVSPDAETCTNLAMASGKVTTSSKTSDDKAGDGESDDSDVKEGVTAEASN